MIKSALTLAFTFITPALFSQSTGQPAVQQLPFPPSPTVLCSRSPAVCEHDIEVHFRKEDEKRDSGNKHTDDGREEWLTVPIPHPYLSFGPSLMEDGYAPLAYRTEVGIDMESSHAIVSALGAYDNGHKSDDGDQPNPKGHDRYLGADAYFRSSRGWFVGMGWRWSQLSTTNYTKGGNRPEFGGGYDWIVRSCDGCRRDFSMRINIDWVTSGTDWQNGSHGPNTTLTFPSPREKRHWFWRQMIGVYRFHQTVTEPTNLPLVNFQLSKRYITSVLDSGVLYRF